MIELQSLSESEDKLAFMETFCRVSEGMKPPYHLGQLRPEVTRLFFGLPYPQPVEFWIAHLDGKPCGRIGANVAHRDPSTGNAGFFYIAPSAGETTAHALLGVATQWLGNHGITECFGPLNLNTYFPYRFRIDPDDHYLFEWEPVNPPEYPAYFESFGFKRDKLYTSKAFHDLVLYRDNAKHRYDECLKKGYSFQPITQDSIQKDLPRLYHLAVQSFEDTKDNYLYESIDFPTFQQIYRAIIPYLQDKLSYFAVAPNGEVIGFFFTFIDQGYLVMKTIVMDPSARGEGVASALMYPPSAHAIGMGVDRYIHALIKEDAQSNTWERKAGNLLWVHQYHIYKYTK